MKKSTLIMALALILSLALGIGGTLAYLTDTDADVNVFVMGDVQIQQNEQQRVDQSDPSQGLESFEDYKTLLPYVTIDGTHYEEVEVGDYTVEMRNESVKNYVDKIVTVSNTGNNDAFVRTIIAIPTGGVEDSSAAADNWLHYNVIDDDYPDYLDEDYGWHYSKTSSNLKDLNGVDVAAWPASEADFDMVTTEINGVPYKLIIATNENILKPGETTAPSLVGIYLDSRVDKDAYGYFIRIDGTKYYITVDPSEVEILVATQAVQADGFEEAGAWYALDAAFGDITATNHPWKDGMPEVDSPSDTYPDNNPPVMAEVTVSNSTELAKAITDGYDVIDMKAGTYQMPSNAKGTKLTLLGAGEGKTIIEVVPGGQSEAGGQLDYNLDGSTVEFNDLTIKTNSQLYAGYARLSGTYNNCTIQNTYNLGVGNSEFNNCTFNITNEYLRVGGAYNASFNGCTFNTDGRAILVYQDGTSVAQTVTVKDCTFNATAAANTWNGIHVAAVSIDGTNGTYVVNLEGNNVVDSDFNGLWQIKAGEANVTVND